MKKYLSLGVLIIYGLFLGGMVGIISWAFLTLVNLGIHFIWVEIPMKFNFKYWTITVCLVGGVLVGLCQKYFGEYPRLMPEVMREFKKNKRVDYKMIPKALLTALIVLFSGASLGPEAALVGIIGGLSTLVGDILKWSVKGRSLEEYDKIITEFSMEVTLGVVFHAPLIGLTPLIEENDSKAIKRIKTIVYSTTTASGFGALMFLSKIDNRDSFIVHFGNFNLGGFEVISIFPLIALGIGLGLMYEYFGYILHKIFKPLENNKIIIAILGGVILGVIGTYLPYTLFSGEHQIKELVHEWDTIPVYILILTGILKLFLTEICLSTGWRGGHIFPIIFSGTIISYGIASIFNLDPVCTVTILTTAFTSSALRNAVITILLLILFFPKELVWVMLIAGFLSAYIIKKIDSLKATKVEDELGEVS